MTHTTISHAVKKLIVVLAVGSLTMDLLHIDYLETQRAYDSTATIAGNEEEIVKISSASRFWMYALWISPGLLTLGTYFVYPLLKTTRSSKTKKSMIPPQFRLFFLALALLYAPAQELLLSLAIAGTIHGLASFGSRSESSPGLMATFQKVHFCGTREDFVESLPLVHQDRLLDLSKSGGPLRFQDDTYLHCQMIRVRSWVMILLGFLVLYEAISTFRKPVVGINNTHVDPVGQKSPRNEKDQEAITKTN